MLYSILLKHYNSMSFSFYLCILKTGDMYQKKENHTTRHEWMDGAQPCLVCNTDIIAT